MIGRLYLAKTVKESHYKNNWKKFVKLPEKARTKPMGGIYKNNLCKKKMVGEMAGVRGITN